jgi:hypothetical protein
LPIRDRDEDDRRLDELIRRASRPPIDPLAVNRLAQRWQRELAAPSLSRFWITLAAAACVAFLATALPLYMSRPGDANRQGAEGELPNDVPSLRSSEPGTQKLDSPKIVQKAANETGEAPQPTPYERLIMISALRQPPNVARRPPRFVRRDLVNHLSSLDQVDDQTAEQIGIKLDISAAELEREVGQLCLVLRGPRREKAVKLLGHIATGASLDILLRLWPQAAYQDHLTPAVAKLANRAVLANCYLRANSASSRQLLAASLVKQMSDGDVGLLIGLLTGSQQPAELAAALRQADKAIFDALFAALDSESRTNRLAAARALATLNAPEVSRRLMERVVAGERRQEALLALAASDEPTAVRFVSQANRHPVLATALKSALVQAGASPWSSGG